MDKSNVELLVCTNCKKGMVVSEGVKNPGQVLYDNLVAAQVPEGISIKSVGCLANCSNGCSIVLRGQGFWSYVYGNLDEIRHVETILEGVAKYRESYDGRVPWRERPEHFRKNCVARIPPNED